MCVKKQLDGTLLLYDQVAFVEENMGIWFEIPTIYFFSCGKQCVIKLSFWHE